MPSQNHILIIDDDPDIRSLLRYCAEDLGYEVTECSGDSDWMADYDRSNASVIILDLSLPNQDGVEILRGLASRGCTAPIVIVSGMNERLISSAWRLGVMLGLKIPVRLTKPISQDDLRAALSRMLQRTFQPSAEETEAAVRDDQLRVYFQPKVKLNADALGTIVGCEALVRWQHPFMGLLPPDRFIHEVEKAGLIGTLTDVVLNGVIAELEAWAKSGMPLPVSINLTTGQLADLDLPDRLAQRMEKTGLSPGLLEIEITEQCMHPEASTISDVLTRLRLKGFGLTLDDFGTGYSSIAEIYRLPLSEVKIDHSIIKAAETDEDARKIVRVIVDLVHSFDLQVCAEGVETEAAEFFLREVGCDMAQGFHFSKPLSSAEFRDFLSKPSATPRAEAIPANAMAGMQINLQTPPRSQKFGRRGNLPQSAQG